MDIEDIIKFVVLMIIDCVLMLICVVLLIAFRESWFFYVLIPLLIVSGYWLFFKSPYARWHSELHNEEFYDDK